MQPTLNRPRAVSFLLLAASLLAALPARAQAGKPAVTLSAVDGSAFPAMQAYAIVNNADGQHVAGLPASSFTLAEDGVPVAGLQAAEADVGVQVVFVVDSSAAFKGRDANGVTRLDYVKQALAEYARTKPWMKTGVDDVTVIAPESPVAEHSDDSGLIAQAVAGYQSTFAGVADPFTLVNSALDFASDATRRPGMRRFVVVISNGFPRPDVQGQVADVATRAAGVGAIIDTVYVGPVGAGNTLPAQNLKKLADATGGQALILDTPQSFTPLFQMLADQGRQYRLSYRSSLSTTGQNRLSLAVKLPDGSSLSSSEAAFPLRLEAPRIALGSLPASLVRVAPAPDSAPANAQPSQYEVPLAIDFPDGHPRLLKLVQLLVDGQVVATQANTSSVTSLVWPLAAYSASATHRLQVRAIDELGLAAESQPADVSVSLQVPAGAAAAASSSPAAVVNANWPLLALALGGLLVAAGVGGGVWLVVSRRPAPAQPAVGRRRAQVAVKPAPGSVPADLPVPTELGATIPMAPATRPPANGHGSPVVAPAARPMTGRRLLPHVALPAWRWPGHHARSGPQGAAFLRVIEAGDNTAPLPDIELLEASLTLGRDADVADTVFQDRSVSRRHARIVVTDDEYCILDCGSTSGTWVNYTPVPPEVSQPLHDGDLINLGRVQLRFQRRGLNAAARPKARVAAVAAPASADGSVQGGAPGNADTPATPAQPAPPAPPAQEGP